VSDALEAARTPLAFLSALGAGLVAGVLFAFSSFVMKALARLPPEQGVAAMQSVNVAALNAWFMAAFMGTAALALAAVVSGLLRWHAPGSPWLAVGGALYLVGVFGVTAAVNVPWNDRLAAVPAASPEAAALWLQYLDRWTTWNHLRSAAALAASAAFIAALRAR
jgi:uncharacterized membrane protein